MMSFQAIPAQAEFLRGDLATALSFQLLRFKIFLCCLPSFPVYKGSSFLAWIGGQEEPFLF